jgi:hypothetical protein
MIVLGEALAHVVQVFFATWQYVQLFLVVFVYSGLA